MGDSQGFGFGKFVPGFDFLQNLTKQASASAAGAIPQLPNLSSWVAPTLNVEELEKRIEELKAVHFWLEQNAKVLGATIQALEVQKMTLATLKGMNFSVGDMANAFKLKATETVGSALMGGAQKVGEKASGTAKSAFDMASGAAGMAASAVGGAASGAVKAVANKRKASAAKSATAAGVVDPMQWWGALTEQFQGIAANAMKDVARNTAIDTTRHMATGMAKEAIKSASGIARAAGKTLSAGAAPRKAAPRKAAAKTTRRKTAR